MDVGIDMSIPFLFSRVLIFETTTQLANRTVIEIVAAVDADDSMFAFVVLFICLDTIISFSVDVSDMPFASLVVVGITFWLFL